MCEHDSESAQHEKSVTHRLIASRRGVLASAIALAGAAATGAVAHADQPDSRGGRGGQDRPPTPAPLILTGATLLDPATGDVTPDTIIVFLKSKVAFIGAAGSMKQAQRSFGRDARVVDVAGRFVSPRV